MQSYIKIQDFNSEHFSFVPALHQHQKICNKETKSNITFGFIFMEYTDPNLLVQKYLLLYHSYCVRIRFLLCNGLFKKNTESGWNINTFCAMCYSSSLLIVDKCCRMKWSAAISITEQIKKTIEERKVMSAQIRAWNAMSNLYLELRNQSYYRGLFWHFEGNA